MDDLTSTVRQIGQYPVVTIVNPADLFLMQQGGFGGPYRSVAGPNLFTALANSAAGISIGFQRPGSGNIGVTSGFLTTLSGARQGFNWYADPNGIQRYLQNGVAGQWSFGNDQLSFAISNVGVKDQQVYEWFDLLQLSPAGQMRIAQQLQVGRNPGRPNEVVTLQFLQDCGVTSFNKRHGDITLAEADMLAAICADPCDHIATQSWLNAAICNGIAHWYATMPFVYTFNGRVGDIFLTVDDISYGTHSNPGFYPQTPSPPDGDDSQAIPSTAWVQSEFDAHNLDWQTAFNELQTMVTEEYAPLASPVFTGHPTAPTAPPGDNSGDVATTAFVARAVAASVAGVASWNTRTGNVVLTLADVTGVGGAPINSPVFTGTPHGPDPGSGNNTDQLATCTWVLGELASVSAGVLTFNARSGVVTLQASDVTGVGGALVNSPAFTGVPTAPTAAADTNSTQIATTAFVMASSVASFNSRVGAVTLNSNDVSAAGGALLASPALTGVPTAPTPPTATNTTQLATTAFVQNAIAGISAGVSSFNTRTGAVNLTLADVLATGDINFASGFVNKFRNGGFTSAQFGTSRGVTAGTKAFGFADGWYIVGATSAVVTTQLTAATTPPAPFGGFAMGLTSNTGAITGLEVSQRIESIVAAGLLNRAGATQAVTVQFTITNNTAASVTPQLSTTTPTARDNYTSTNADLAAVNLQPCPAGQSTVVAYTYLPSSAAALKLGTEIVLNLGNAITASGASAGIIVSRADMRATPTLPVGLTAAANLPFPEIRDPASELNFCSRYVANYSRLYIGGYAAAGAGPVATPGLLRTPMRTQPTSNYSVNSQINLQAGGIIWQVIGSNNDTYDYGANAAATGNLTVNLSGWFLAEM